MFKILFISLFLTPKIISKTAQCILPTGCRSGAFHYINGYNYGEYVSLGDKIGFICDVHDASYRFDLETWRQGNYLGVCVSNKIENMLDLRFPAQSKRKSSLGKYLNLQGILDFLLLFNLTFTLHLTNVNGYNIDLGIRLINMSTQRSYVFVRRDINIIRNEVEFYNTSGKLVKSCRDLLKSAEGEVGPINSIFQLTQSTKFSEINLFRCNYR